MQPLPENEWADWDAAGNVGRCSSLRAESPTCTHQIFAVLRGAFAVLLSRARTYTYARNARKRACACAYFALREPSPR